MAPILYARPNTVGKFTDLPLLMWYEVVPTPRGRQYRYSVIFSNEDGGTQTDRLMATWGRTTDIEFVYGVEVDERDRILAEEFQGPGHEVPAFKGRHEGASSAAVGVDRQQHGQRIGADARSATRRRRCSSISPIEAREAVMDAHPWTYAIASVEMRREGKIADDPPPGINKIPDPRRFVFVEACGTVGNAALARLSRQFSRQSQSQPDLTWTPSDRGLPQYRIVRDGCFTIATPLPAGTRALRHSRDSRARVRAAAGRGQAAGAADPVTFTRINKVFMLDEHDLPGRRF